VQVLIFWISEEIRVTDVSFAVRRATQADLACMLHAVKPAGASHRVIVMPG
jgi:hypothetical protein